MPGFTKGLVWSAGFGVAAGGLFLSLFMAGHNPLMLIRSPLPQGTTRLILFFCVGGIVAPIAEEIVFRGLIFGYLRRWGLPAAILISTALFAFIHLVFRNPTIPVTQIVGGLVFAVAYHMGKSLMVPIVIHTLGNLAIFTLSLPILP
jgi:membrane protease YdiL (CAAX protease family)